MVIRDFNPSTPNAEAIESMWVQGQPDLLIEILPENVFLKLIFLLGMMAFFFNSET